MSSFKGTRKIILQPYDSGLVFDFTITSNSTPTANDGFLPYGRSVSSVVLSATTEDGTTCTSALIDGTATIALNVISVKMKYPTQFGPGRYFLRLIITMDDSNKIEADFTRIFAENTGS